MRKTRCFALNRSERIKSQVFHWEILNIIRHQSEFVDEGHSGDCGISNGDSCTFTGVIPFQEAGESRDGPCEMVVFEASKKFFGGFLFFWSHPSIDFCHVYRAASQQMALLH